MLAKKEIAHFRRFRGYDYSRGAALFITIVTNPPHIALRISRKLSLQQIGEAVERIRRRIGDYVFVGGWISPGEKAVRDMLLAEPQGKIIQILPSAMPHDYRPGSAWLPAIRDRRAAIIARGNSEIEFSRAACLEVNDEARKIATQALLSGEGAGGGLPGGVGLSGGVDGAGLPSGVGLPGGVGGKAVYWLPEGPKLIS